MKIQGLEKIKCVSIERYTKNFDEQHVIVCDTETVQGKPYTIQFYDGIETTLIYVNEKTIFDVYCDYVAKRIKPHTSVWFFYCQFDLPIIHYPYKQYFTLDNHQMGYGEFEFNYITGKTWFGNHTYNNIQWHERDAFQYVFRGLEKVAKDLLLSVNKKPRPEFLGERKWATHDEKRIFEEYAIADVLVLWELVYWILSLHRQYNVGLSVSLADLCGKIFRKKYVDTPVQPTDQAVTMAALRSYHGGKTEMYVKGPMIIQNIYEYDIVSAYPFAMTQISNFSDYEIIPYQKGQTITQNGLYRITGQSRCNFQPLYTEDFTRSKIFMSQWVTGWELSSALTHQCFDGVITEGYSIISHDGKNGLSDYIWHFFELKAKAKAAGNVTETLWAKLALNTLYGKFISKIAEEVDLLETWRGGVIFHPLIATMITGHVRGYIHEIEHAGNSYHTSTDAIICHHDSLDTQFPGVNGLGALKKEYQGDVLLVRPKVYVIFDKLDPHCYHKFTMNDQEKLYCVYCKANVLKTATHGFFGSVQMLLNMWKHDNTHYVITRMMRLKEAAKRKDPDVLPFVFSKQRRSLNVDWSKLTLWKG